MKSTNLVLLLTTIDNEVSAKKLAQSALQAKLVACVNIIAQVQSFYWWQNTLENSQEYQLIFKTTLQLQNQLVDFIKSQHPYQTAEIIVLKPSFVEPDYLSWLNESIKI